MLNSKLNPRLKLKELLGDIEFSEEEANQISQKSRELEANYLNNLPTFFRGIRASRELLRDMYEGITIEKWQLPFTLAVFNYPDLKRTRRNLRLEFKGSPRKKKIISTSLGFPFTTRVYVDSNIQNLFEFSLLYSYFLKKELSAEQAKKVFINACKVSIGLSIQNIERTENLEKFIEFINGLEPVLATSNLPTFGRGRSKRQTEDTNKILRLCRQGYKPREIAAFLYPGRSPQDKTQLAESIRKVIQRAKKRDK